MLDLQDPSDDRPVVFCLHYLGGSAREWSHVTAAAKALRCIALDLPGFGDAVRAPGYTVAEMSAYVAERVREHAPRRWLLAGHSMGAKVATVLARAIEDGAVDLPGFEGLVLLAGSPSSPEPIDEKQREKMIGWFAGDADANRANAETYVSSNAESLDSASFALAVDDATRMERAAWLAWLERGSREDWSDRVGRLKTPALVLAGERDENLGPDAQRDLMAPHFERARLVTLPGAKHLLPLERAREVARLMDEHAIAAGYRALVVSGRVGAKTRDALQARERSDDPAYAPRAMDVAALATLRAMAERIVPQDDADPIDLGARIDTALAGSGGDGWRFDVLPPDADAYRAGTRTLQDAARKRYGRAFETLDPERQDDMLLLVASGELGADDGETAVLGRLGRAAMRAWFEDVRAGAVKAYLGHPRTLARIGYSGIANGGDGEPKTGFARIGIGEREAWEPVARVDRAR